MTFTYRCYGVVLGTSERLEGLRPVPVRSPDLEVCFDRRPGFSVAGLHPAWDDDGPEALRGRVDAEGWTLAWPGCVRFDGRLDDPRIRARVHVPDVPRARVQHLLLNHAVPLVLSLRGHVLLHGACLARARRAIGILGASGAGKSTLALRLAGRGARVLSDDAIRVLEEEEGLSAAPGYPGVRLWDEDLAREGLSPQPGDPSLKRWVEVGRAADDASCPLERLYVLELGGRSDVEVSLLRGAERFAALVRHAFTLEPLYPAGARELLPRLATVGERLPVYRVRAPRDRTQIDAIADRLWSHGFDVRRPETV